MFSLKQMKATSFCEALCGQKPMIASVLIHLENKWFVTPYWSHGHKQMLGPWEERYRNCQRGHQASYSISSKKKRCSPRTRMLTRMLMAQMSKHMDMQSRRTLFCNSIFEQSCTYFPCYHSAVWSVECCVWSVKCRVWSVKCGVWSVKCRVRSVGWKV